MVSRKSLLMVEINASLAYLPFDARLDGSVACAQISVWDMGRALGHCSLCQRVRAVVSIPNTTTASLSVDLHSKLAVQVAHHLINITNESASIRI